MSKKSGSSRSACSSASAGSPSRPQREQEDPNKAIKQRLAQLEDSLNMARKPDAQHGKLTRRLVQHNCKRPYNAATPR